MKTAQTMKRAKKAAEVMNVKLTDGQIKKLLKPKKKVSRVIVASAGPISFDVSPVDLVHKRVKVTAILLAFPVGDVILDEDCVETSIGPNVGLAKAFITLSVNWEQKKVSYIAKACIRNWRMQWKCADYKGTLASW